MAAFEVEAEQADPNDPTATVATEETSDSERFPEVHPRRRFIFFIVSIGLFMASIDGTIVATALTRIGDSLHSTINWTAWSVTIYQLGQMIAMPLAGKISDQFGRKKVYLISSALFTGTSLVCGLSTSIYMLVGFRFLQSLGGGAFMPSAVGIVSDHFGRDRDRAIGMFTSIMPIGGIVGPIFGGVITQDWTWRGIFFINIPIGMVLLVLVAKFIPRGTVRPGQHLDVRGVSLISLCILAGMFGITSLGDTSILEPRVYLPFVAAIVLGVAFVRHTKRDASPFIPMNLLTGKGFANMNVLNFLYGTAVFGFGAVVPIYAINRYHINVANSGTLLSARGFGMVCVAAAAAMLLRRTGYRLPMVVGFLLMAISLVMLWYPCPHDFSAYLWLGLWSLVTGLGLGIAAPATNNAVLQLAPDQVGQISGLRGTFRQSGGILYISGVTAFIARSHDPGLAQAKFFLLQAAVLVVMLVFVARVEEHKGVW